MSCPLCDGTGWKPIEEHGVTRMMRCDCWRETLSAQLLQAANIPTRYSHCSLERFVIYENPRLVRAVERVKRFVEAFPTEKGMCLIGPHGIGKTHLAVAALRQVIVQYRVTGLYFETTRLLKTIRETYGSSRDLAEMDVLRPVLDAQVLVLDDLGKEKPSEWVSETLNLIVDSRYNYKLLTVFISNYLDTPDIEDPDSLLVRVGRRIHSRLHEMCDFVEFDGADYRHLPPNGGVDDLMILWKQRGRQDKMPAKTKGPLRAQLRDRDRGDLKWSGGKAGR